MKSCETLIIGGGMIGVCTAYFLAKNGRSVTLIEKSDICAGASHGNAGWVATAAHAIPLATPGSIRQGIKWLLDNSGPLSIKPRLDRDLIRWLWQFQVASRETRMRQILALIRALNEKSLALFKEIHQEEQLSAYFAQTGMLHLFIHEETYQKALKNDQLIRPFGVTSQPLNRDEIKAVQPNIGDAVQAGLFYPEPAHLDPGSFIRELAQKAVAYGAEIVTNCEVLGFETRDGAITAVSTTRGHLKARQIVLAAGAWSKPLARQLGIRLLMEPAKGYSITAQSNEFSPRLPLSLDDHKIAATPMGAHFRFSSTLELAGLDDRINGRRLTATRHGIQHYLTGMDSLEIVEIWRGFRPTTPDSLPLLGRHSRYDNLVLATGHGTLGITHGPITGKLVSQLLLDEPLDLEISPFSLQRF